MLHALSHSLAKTSLFLTSGNILHVFKSKKITEVKAILKKDSLTGWFWIISIFVIIGIPPSPVFLSKFLIIKAFWLNGTGWLTVLFFLFIIIVSYGMFSSVFSMTFGEDESGDITGKRLSWFAYIPQFTLLIILVILGTGIPSRVLELLNNASGFLR
jgi:hydrogenase-4 component F